MEKITLKKLKNKRFHFIGIGGISMSALAQFLFSNGIYVQGSDLAENDETIKLKKLGLMVYDEHNENNLQNIDVVVYTSAIHDDNPELKFARANNLTILKRAELLGMVASMYKTVISVAGSHGKTTTTAMISEIFLKAGLNPTLFVGGSLNSINSNYKIGSKEYFITEACEYKDNFLYIAPDIAVVLNIDSDHLDYFGSLDGVKTSFKKYIDGLKRGGIKIISADDKNSKVLITKKHTATFGVSENADMRAININCYKDGYYEFEPVFMGCVLGKIKLNIIGKHNVVNALAAILVSLVCGISFSKIKDGLENFEGTERRCQKIGEINGATVFHDYAHHPAQISKMIDVAKELTNNGGRVITVFEPHTYSRTKFLLDEFAKSFKKSDMVIFAPVYSARENPEDGVDSSVLAEHTKRHVKNVRYLNTFNEIYEEVKAIAQSNDIILILGAGTIEHLANMFKL